MMNFPPLSKRLTDFPPFRYWIRSINTNFALGSAR
jgi:hypothetical protein